MLDTSRSVKKYQLSLFAAFIVSAILLNTCWNKAYDAREAYLKSLDLSLTLRVIDVKPTNNHGFGAIYGEVIKSNKPNNYVAIYKNEYTFCKTLNKKIILISDASLINKGDSIIINSAKLQYKIFRNDKLTLTNKLTFSTDFFLAMDIGQDKLLDFKTYK